MAIYFSRGKINFFNDAYQLPRCWTRHIVETSKITWNDFVSIRIANFSKRITRDFLLHYIVIKERLAAYKIILKNNKWLNVNCQSQ